LGQAKDYAERLNIRFTYCTNGLQIYGVDMEEGTEGDVSRYPTPDELWEMTYPTPKEDYKIEIEGWKDRFFDIPFEDRGGTWSAPLLPAQCHLQSTGMPSPRKKSAFC
jgi:type I restriction enzyme R subunit